MTDDLNNLLSLTMKIDPETFLGKTILITGAGRGIGFHTARAFALLGGRVVLAEISDEGIEAERIIRDEGGDAHFIRTDVSDSQSVKALADQTKTLYGPVDILVNNAIHIQQAAVWETSLESWDKTIAVNLRGTFLTCRAFVPEMLANGKGTIINMVSTDAMPGLSAYIASKQGILGFSQTLALELNQSGVRVIPFGPGMVDTPGIRSVADGLAPRLGLSPEQFLNLSLHAEYEGLMPPEHAAAATVFLAANLADEFDGQMVNGYEILESAGVLKTELPDDFPIDQANPHHNQTLYELFKELEAILIETESEFGQLPIFVRPMAKQGFKNKSGARLSDWQKSIAEMKASEKRIPIDLVERLNGLALYYREVPKETARFTKDSETLKQITQTAHKRLEVIEALQEEIKSLNP